MELSVGFLGPVTFANSATWGLLDFVSFVRILAMCSIDVHVDTKFTVQACSAHNALKWCLEGVAPAACACSDLL